MIQFPNKVSIIAPHPDDETLGAGGSIAKFISMGSEVSVLIVSGHMPPLYKIEDYNISTAEALRALSILGTSICEFLNIPATKVNEIAIADLNRRISEFMDKHKPDLLFIPFPDRHIDHRVIFDSSVVAARPTKDYFPKTVLCYETLSETHWNTPGIEASFNPDFFIDIDNFIEKKIKALQTYKSQINENTPSRSIDACKALARFRGSQNGCNYAEAFKVVRIVV